MIRIHQIKMNIDHTEADLRSKILKMLHLKEDALLSFRIRKRSLDARKKPNIYYVYTIDAKVKQENRVLKKSRSSVIQAAKIQTYEYPNKGTEILSHRPVIVGSGPAGLFCAYLLSEMGYCPILIERGAPVEERIKDVEEFWETGVLNPNSNVQFGEGGAGTFSDGKLNTVVKDIGGRNQKVLEIFVQNGAPKSILYENKPHIGTDILFHVIKNMRNFILRHGGEFRYHEQMTELIYEEAGAVRVLKGVKTRDLEKEVNQNIETNIVVLAIGHSARDTFYKLYEQQIPMQAKAFAVGVRIEHLQNVIDKAQYGCSECEKLPASSYKFTETLPNKRGVYTFCMCPGGYVVNASSEEGRLAVNGMSYHNRDGKNANSAVIVTVSPKDYNGDSPLSGLHFQRTLEERAYEIGNGNIPVQRFEDFCRHVSSNTCGTIVPAMKGNYTFANVRNIFPEFIAENLEQGIWAFDKKCKGYASPDALLSGVESRTSSPVRILREEDCESVIKGLYPCGEGAGYAGGITSAALDGLKIGEIIVKKYRPFDISCE